MAQAAQLHPPDLIRVVAICQQIWPVRPRLKDRAC